MAIENAEVAQQINQAIIKQNKLLAKGTKELKDQLSIMHGIQASRKGADYDKAIDQVRLMTKGLQQLEEQAEETGDKGTKAIRDLADQAAKGKGSFSELGGGLKKHLTDNFPTMAGAALGAFNGMKTGLSIVTSAATAAWGAVTQLGSGILGLGKSIIAIPFKILGGLVNMANNLPNDAAFARAREAIRKDFGSFSEDISKNIRGTYKEMGGQLDKTGLSVFRVMGNWAERLEYIHELAKGMGPLFHEFGEEVRRNGEAIIAYQKGLGISHEQMKGIGALAKRQGRTLTDTLNEITIASTGMGDAFDISAKVISRDMAEMTNDVANFGSMTIQEMAKAATYVRKLGLEIKDVLGIIEKYDNFEDAAMGAAHLAQAFGANVDALEMMREQDPSKRIDMMRKSMAAAGVDAERLSRQELKLLANQTGLSEEAAKTAFSLKNQGVSMSDLEKQQGRSEKKTMTQEEAMVKLSDSIERMVKTGQRSGGFFAQFFKGFERGIKRFSPFRLLLRDIRRDLRIVFRLGIKTGRAFVKFFPGVMKMVEGMREFFDPKRFRKLSKDLKEVFDALFDESASIEAGLQRIKDIFWDFFTGKAGGAAFKKIYEGALKFGTIIMKWLGEGIRMGMTKLTEAFNWLADVISDPSGVMKTLKEGLGGAGSPFLAMFEPIATAIMNNWRPLWKAFKGLMETVWTKVGPTVIEFGKKALIGMLAVIFAPAVIQGALGAVTGSVLQGLGKWVTGWFGKKGVEGAAKVGAKKFLKSKVITQFGARAGAALRVAGPIGLAIGAALGVSEGLDLFMDKIDPKFDETTRKMAAAGTGIIHGLTFGLLPEGLEVMIADSMATVQTFIFDGLEMIFGASFVANLKDYINPLIDFWGSLGDTIIALVTGDEAKFDKAFDELLMSLGRTLLHGMKFLVFEAIPGILKFLVKGFGMVGRGLQKAVRMIFDKVKDIVVNIVRAIFGDVVADGFDVFLSIISNVYETVSQFFVGVIDLISGFVTSFTEFVNLLYDSFTEGFNAEKWSAWAGRLWDRVKKPFFDFVDAIDDMWIGWFNDLKGYWNGLTAWFDDAIGGFMGTIDAVKGVFRDPGKSWEDAKGWGSGLVDGVTAGASDLFARSSNNVGKRMIEGVIEEAQKAVEDGSPKIEEAIDVAQGKWTKKLLEFGDKFKAGWEKIKAQATFKEEAEMMGAEGISLEDMSLYQKIKDLDPAEIETQLDKFRTKIIPLFVGGGDIKPENSLLGQIKRLGNMMEEGDDISIGKLSKLGGSIKAVAAMGESAMIIAKVSEALNPFLVQSGMMYVEMSLEYMATGMSSIAASIGDVEAMGVHIAAARIKGVATVIEEMVQRVNSINEELGEVKTEKVQVKLKNLAKSLGVKNQKFTIRNDKIKIQIALDVNLDAEQMAYQIHKGKWFTLSKGEKGLPKKRH